MWLREPLPILSSDGVARCAIYSTFDERGESVARVKADKIVSLSFYRGTQRQFAENICSEDDLRYVISDE